MLTFRRMPCRCGVPLGRNDLMDEKIDPRMFARLNDLPRAADVNGREGADRLPDVGRLADLLSGPLGDFTFRGLRVRPRQARSIDSVERILSAAATMTLRKTSAHPLSIERVASAAGVTPQAAYRYFKDIDELVRTGLRCLVLREHERVITILSGRVLVDEPEMARAIVGLLLESCQRLYRLPAHLRDDVLQEYRQTGYDVALLMAEHLCEGVEAPDIRRSIDVVKMSVALTATTAVATSFFSKRVSPLSESRLEDILADLLIGVLRSGGSASDAFREVGFEFCLLWNGVTR